MLPNTEAYMIHVYREWPGDYEIPGVGVPEAWARKSAKKAGINDGEPAGGQEKFGFGLLRYKFEIARLEGWADYEAWMADGQQGYEEGGWILPHDELLEQWHEEHGSRENVKLRLVDGRACMQSKIGMQADKALIDLLNEMGMGWAAASGANISSGETIIEDMMKYVKDRDGVLLQKPTFTVSPHCINHIWAFENYIGTDGLKAACKEPLDCCRYVAQSGVLDGSWQGNVMVLDPAVERNWFMGWYRIGQDGQCEGQAQGPARTDGSLRGRRDNQWADTIEAMAQGSVGVQSRRMCGNLRRW
jgi:hypothetical protein